MPSKQRNAVIAAIIADEKACAAVTQILATQLEAVRDQMGTIDTAAAEETADQRTQFAGTLFTMTYDKSTIRKGMFLTSTPGNGGAARRYRERDKALEKEHPEWAETFKSAGPVPTSERLKQLATERQELSNRMVALKAKIAAVKVKQ